jgi:phosphatidylglycerophosphate synthase
VTLFSLLPAAVAGLALASGRFGLACMFATIGSLCDLVDGLLARRLGIESEAGALLDAVVDRAGEFLFLAGLAIHYRLDAPMLTFTMLALFGGFSVSYVSAKAAAMNVSAPRGAMRRPERVVYLLLACCFTSLTRPMFAGSSSLFVRELPMCVAVVLVGVVAQLSTLSRLLAMAELLRSRRLSLSAARRVRAINENGRVMVETESRAGSL